MGSLTRPPRAAVPSGAQHRRIRAPETDRPRASLPRSATEYADGARKSVGRARAPCESAPASLPKSRRSDP